MLIPFNPPKVFGMDDSTQDLLSHLVKEWGDRRPRNVLRKQYRDSKQVTRVMGIAVPPAFRDLEVAVGLPELAVESLADRIMWDGIVAPGGGDDPFELRSILDDNRFDIEFPQAIDSALTYSTSFISTIAGDTSDREPVVKITMHSAMWSAGLWDRGRRALKGMLAINDVDYLGLPTEMTLYTPFQVIIVEKGAGVWNIKHRWNHFLYRVPAEPLPYKPTLDRPFGQARINRRVMSQTDRAVNAILRLEVHSELFAAIKLLLLGADEDSFRDINGNQMPLWDWYTGRMNTFSRDDNDNIPTLEVIAQQSPQPHIDTLKAIYSQYSGETKVPMNSLGIVSDNPDSADAIREAKEGLTVLARNAARVFSYSLNRIFQNVVMIRDGLREVPDELRMISQRFRNPAMPSVVSQSDAMVKQISAIPKLAETDVALEELGYTEDQILRIKQDWKTAGGLSAAQQIIEAARGRESRSGADASATTGH